MTGERFTIVEDGSGHLYVVPAHKRAEAVAWIEAVEAYWENPPKNDNIREPDQPEWMDMIGGSLSLLTFTDPKIGEGD